MTHFLVEYSDSGDAEKRAANRVAHIEYRKGLGDRLPLAGPILDDKGASVGSLVIIEAADRAAAERTAKDDPMAKAGVLTVVSVRPYRIMAMKPPPPAPAH